jgi:hypothetical protein
MTWAYLLLGLGVFAVLVLLTGAIDRWEHRD